jgi:hypothetical protein
MRTACSRLTVRRSCGAGGHASCPHPCTRTCSPASSDFITCRYASNARAPPPSAPADRVLDQLLCGAQVAVSVYNVSRWQSDVGSARCECGASPTMSTDAQVSRTALGTTLTSPSWTRPCICSACHTAPCTTLTMCVPLCHAQKTARVLPPAIRPGLGAQSAAVWTCGGCRCINACAASCPSRRRL